MKLRFLIPCLSVIHFAGVAQDSIGESRIWTSHSGAKLRGSLLSCYNGKVMINSDNNRKITVGTNQFSETDVEFIKQAAFNELASVVKSNDQAGANANWPDVVFVDPNHCQVTKGDKNGKWHVWTTKHWKFHTERDLPKPIVEQLAKIFEGTMRSIQLVSPDLVPKNDKKLQIHLFSTLDGLRKEVERTTPGRDKDWNSVVCVDEMLGLKHRDGTYSLDPQAPNRFIKMELYELAMQDCNAGGPMPMWLYYGFRRLVSRIPQRGMTLFPRAAFTELTSESFKKQAMETMPTLPGISSKQWFDSTPDMRKGKSEPTYRRHLRQASFVYCSYLRALTPNGAEITNNLIRAAASDTSIKRDALNTIALQKRPINQYIEAVATAFTKYHNQQWQPLSARTIRRPRKWVNQSGKTLPGELRGIQAGGKIAIKASNGQNYFIPLGSLSARDQAYALANIDKSIDYESILTDVAGAGAISKNFWPSTLSFPAGGITRARISKEESSKGKFVYKTKHFHFTLFGRYPISEAQMEEIARLFEATRELLTKSPIGVQASPIDGYFRAELYDSEAAYHLAGGPKMSGGVYKRSSRKFLVPVERGAFKPASGGLNAVGDRIMEVKYYKETLVHEIVHMMMHDILTRLPIFMIEGTAEYVEHMPRKQNAFHHSLMMDGVRETAARYDRKQRYYQQRGETVPGPYNFEKLLTLSRKGWYDYIGDSSHRQGAVYYGSFLLVSYFMQQEPDRIIAMLGEGRKDTPGLKVYDFEDAQYDKAVAEFKKFPGVKVEGNGYTYSSHLPHPDRPTPPLSGVDSSDTAHVKILLNGRTAGEVADKAYNWLYDNQIRVDR